MLRTLLTVVVVTLAIPLLAEDAPVVTKALIDGTGPGWVDLTEADFDRINTDPDTFQWTGTEVHCKGTPVGVTRSKKKFTNFEMVATWRHNKSGGNSGIFLWAPDAAFKDLKPNQLPPGGIEVQILDHGYAEQYEKANGKKSDWFTTHGDVFPVGSSTMVPFEPKAPAPKDSQRAFPRKELSKGIGQWNHYYIRAINGEVRLWVNGEEVSGGNHCEPKTGFLCLESEGAPIDMKGLRIRELP